MGKQPARPNWLAGANAGEDSPTTLSRWNAFHDHLSQIVGPASYANAREQIGEKVAPTLAPRTSEGMSGYYSALVVKADSP